MALHVSSLIKLKGIPKTLNSYFRSKNEVVIVFEILELYTDIITENIVVSMIPFYMAG